MWWAFVWPLVLAVWAFGFTFFACCYHGCESPARRSLWCVCCLSAAVCGLIVLVSLPTWLEWVHLHARGVPVRAKVVSTEEEYDQILERYVTRVVYQFEAEGGGQPRQFRREGELRGRYLMASGFIKVLYDPADPAHSRMTREFRGARDGMVAAAVCLALGVACRRFSRGPRRVAGHA